MSGTPQRVQESESDLKPWKSSYAPPVDTPERIRLKSLERRRKLEADHISTPHLAMASVKSLLPEILEDIFNHFNGEGLVTIPPSKPGKFSPWILGHVCASWRCVLWNSPSIWTKIVVQRGRAMALGSRSRLAIRETLNYILSNTSTAISLSANGVESQVIFDLILLHSRRFRSLTLHWILPDMLHTLLELPPYSLSSLEVLDVDWRDSRNPESSSTTSSLQTASSLRTVAFSSYGTTHIPQILLLPWAQLVNLQITCMELTTTTIYATLQKCPGLISTHLSIDCNAVIPTQSPFTLHRLTKLSFTTSHTQFLNWNLFLQPLTTPALISLTISSQRIPIPTINHFLFRSGCSLQELSITARGRDTDDEGLESLLELLPKIIRIRIPWMIPAPMIRNIFREPNGILPLLTYGSWKVEPSGLAAVLVMIGSYMSHVNQHGHRPLCLSIGCYEGPGFKDVEDAYLKSYDAYKIFEGLDISVYNASASRTIGPNPI